MNLKRCLHASCRLGLSGIVKNPLKVFIGVLVFIVVLVFYILLLGGSGKELASIQKTCTRTDNNENKEVVFEREISRDTDTADDISNAVKLAKRVSKYNGSVLVSVVNDAFLPFAYSWLCNTKSMNVHKSVLIITTDAISKQRLNTDWPEVNVVKLDLKIPPGNQEFSRAGYLQIMIRRTEMLLELLLADIEILLLEFDYMWFVNPIPHLQRMKGVDFLVNPVSGKVIAFNGGFLYMFPTERSKTLWKKLTEMMHELGEQLENKAHNYAISIEHNDQVYFSSLIKQRYANVTTRTLPLDTYADGKWYELSASDRRSKPTFVISNNFIRGNANKMKRAKKWHHWFLRDDCTCDFDLVNKMVRR